VKPSDNKKSRNRQPYIEDFIYDRGFGIGKMQPVRPAPKELNRKVPADLAMLP